MKTLFRLLFVVLSASSCCQTVGSGHRLSFCPLGSDSPSDDDAGKISIFYKSLASDMATTNFAFVWIRHSLLLSLNDDSIGRMNKLAYCSTIGTPVSPYFLDGFLDGYSYTICHGLNPILEVFASKELSVSDMEYLHGWETGSSNAWDDLETIATQENEQDGHQEIDLNNQNEQ